MKFSIDYSGSKQDRLLTYHIEEYSFDMEPSVQWINFDIVVNKLNLTVVDEDNKIVQLDGFCGLNASMKSNYAVPESQKGILRVTDDLKPGFGSYYVKKEEQPVFINMQTGWVCIGDPVMQGEAVEFINNCVAVIDDNREFVALWLKPDVLPDI